jgi:hypothetical protein
LSPLRILTSKRPRGPRRFPENAQKIERAFETAVGILIAGAQAGTIKMNRDTLNAFRAVRFDHMHGTYSIGGTTFSALTLIASPAEGAPA